MHSYLHLFPMITSACSCLFNSQGQEGAVGHLRQASVDRLRDRYFPGPWPAALCEGRSHGAAKLMAGYYDDSRGLIGPS